jgi:hypothetical protein
MFIIDNVRVKHANGEPAGTPQGLKPGQTRQLAEAVLIAEILRKLGYIK